MVPDQEILEGCKSGDKHAFGLLYKKYASTMLGICMRYCKRKEEAEDVLHDVFVNFTRNISDFQLTGSLKAYLATCVANQAKSLLRKKKIHAMAADAKKVATVSGS